jgi:hypothetical protein
LCLKICFQLYSKTAVLQGLKPPFPIGVGKWTVLTTKRQVDLETKLLEIRHMLRPEFFYLGLPKSVLKLEFLNVWGLPFNASS